MTLKRPAIVPPEVWEQAPEPVRVVMHAMVEYYEQRIAQLEAEVRELTARLNQNSQNSSKPPSSEDLVQFANRRRVRYMQRHCSGSQYCLPDLWHSELRGTEDRDVELAFLDLVH